MKYKCERCGYESDDIIDFNTPTGMEFVCVDCYDKLDLKGLK